MFVLVYWALYFIAAYLLYRQYKILRTGDTSHLPPIVGQINKEIDNGIWKLLLRSPVLIIALTLASLMLFPVLALPMLYFDIKRRIKGEKEL